MGTRGYVLIAIFFSPSMDTNQRLAGFRVWMIAPHLPIHGAWEGPKTGSMLVVRRKAPRTGGSKPITHMFHSTGVHDGISPTAVLPVWHSNSTTLAGPLVSRSSAVSILTKPRPGPKCLITQVVCAALSESRPMTSVILQSPWWAAIVFKYL